jgi:hypothetical protein
MISIRADHCDVLAPGAKEPSHALVTRFCSDQ